jgi:excisionase family DNA binding protein
MKLPEAKRSAERATAQDPPHQPTAHIWLTQSEAAKVLRCNVRTLRRYIAEGRLRAFRLGSHRIGIDAVDLECFAREIPTAWSTEEI